MLSVEDQFAITQVLNLYGHVVDWREWHRMREVFTDDVTFASTGFPDALIEGMDMLVERFGADEASHPLAHHATNIVVWEDADGTVRAQSKGFGPRPNPAASKTVTYKDVLRRTPEGWRVAQRHVFLMEPRPNRLPDAER